MRTIADCERVLFAAPAYLAARGTPETPHDLLAQGHNCLLLRFPGSREYYWTFATHDGPVKINAARRLRRRRRRHPGRLGARGAGIANRPRFEIAEHLASGALVPLLAATPAVPIRFACLYPHRRLQDPKVQAFIPWMTERCRQPGAGAARAPGRRPRPPATRRRPGPEAASSGPPAGPARLQQQPAGDAPLLRVHAVDGGQGRVGRAASGMSL